MMGVKLNRMAAVFKVFGDMNRLKIIKMLASEMGGTLCVSDIAEQLGVSQPAVSQHIKILKNIEILIENKVGFRVYYQIDNTMMKRLNVEINDLFNKAYEKCTNSYSCSDCPENKVCE